MRIQHNIMAMSAYRNYTNNVSAMKKNLEKLSSGYKINRAGDDAAGLAISEKMRAQITGLETAQKNAKDGISLVQTAEGALTEVHDMLNRMVELASMSANGTYDNETDRAQLQKEVNQLMDEINRIADSSNFNGIKLLDGSMSTDAAKITGDARIINDVYTSAAGNAAELSGTKTFLDGEVATPETPTVFEVNFDGLTAIDGDNAAGGAGGGTAAVAAVYSFDLTGKAQADVDTKAIDGETITWNTDLDTTMGDFVTAYNAGTHDFTASWANNKLTLTANTAGAVGGTTTGVPAADPTTDITGVTATEDTAGADATGAGGAGGAGGGTAAVAAVYSFDLTGKAQADVDTKAIDGETITWNTDLDTTMGDFVTAYNAGTHDFTASWANNKLTLTANTAGAVGGTTTGVPAADPTTDITGVTAAEDTAGADATGGGGAGGTQVDFTFKIGNTTFTAQANGTDKDAIADAVLTALTGAGGAGGAGGTAAVAAVYSFDLTGKAQADVDTKAIDGETITWNTDLDTTMGDFVTAYNAGTHDFTASWANNKLTLTANAAGAVGGTTTGVPAADPTTDITGVTATEDTAGADATGGGGAGSAAGNTVQINGINYTVAKGDAGKLVFTLADTPTEKNIAANYDWDVTGLQKDSFDGNHTAGVVVTTPGSVHKDAPTANTVFRLETSDIKDGAKITIDGTSVTLAVGKNSVYKDQKNSAGYIDLTWMEENNVNLNQAISAISKGFGGTVTGENGTVWTVGVNDTSNGDTHPGLTVHRVKDTGTVDYDTKAKLASIFSIEKGAGGGLKLQIGDTADSYNQLKVSIKDMHAASLGISGVDISTQDGAAEAITKIKDAINQVSDVRGTLGATQNRLDHTINNLSVMTENIQDAESTIRDVDVAEEMMAYTKNNILIQSAQAMLAQANQVPQGVLQLLQ